MIKVKVLKYINLQDGTEEVYHRYPAHSVMHIPASNVLCVGFSSEGSYHVVQLRDAIRIQDGITNVLICSDMIYLDK